MKYKKGITMASLAVYVILLFVFMAIALNVSSNLNRGLFDDKGVAINMSSYDKLLHYLNKSAIESTNFSANGGKTITFSNQDVYNYDASKQTIYLNGGVLAKDITSFSFTTSNGNYIEINVNFTKYSNSIERQINLYVGE